MTEQNLHKILSDAVSLPAENEIVEFKEAKEGYSFDKLGKYFSALSNVSKNIAMAKPKN